MRFAPAALLLASTIPALAQNEPVIVIPGKPGVPVILNGFDISWAVVERDWGLSRPNQVAPTIVEAPLLMPIPSGRGGYGYYPATGRRPGYGRFEIQPSPDQPLPPPAPSYRRSWSSQSDPGPVTEYAPFSAPPVILAPTMERGVLPRRGP